MIGYLVSFVENVSVFGLWFTVTTKLRKTKASVLLIQAEEKRKYYQDYGSFCCSNNWSVLSGL
jgi:hypothetical protein